MEKCVDIPRSVCRKLDTDPSQSPIVSGTFLAQVFRGHLRWQDYFSEQCCKRMGSQVQERASEYTACFRDTLTNLPSLKTEASRDMNWCHIERKANPVFKKKGNPVRTRDAILPGPRWMDESLLAGDLKHSDNVSL